MLGTTELIVIFAILVLIFGATKIPDLAAGLGKGIRNFKKAINEPDAIDVTPDKKELGKSESMGTPSESKAG